MTERPIVHTQIDILRGDTKEKEVHTFAPARCDFCDRTSVTLPIEYRTNPGWTVDLGRGFEYTEQDGRWAACPECSAFIDREDWEGLFVFSCDRAGATGDPERVEAARIMQGAFREHKLDVRIEHGEDWVNQA
jgi:hypothetical protein